jgi:hypothetical protein
MSRDVHSCTHWLRPSNALPHPPAIGLVYEGLYIGQQRYRRRHLFVTPLLVRILKGHGNERFPSNLFINVLPPSLLLGRVPVPILVIFEFDS